MDYELASDILLVGHKTNKGKGILLDDNNRKPICRLWLNGGKKHIGIFDDKKTETKHEITSLDDIFNYSDQLIATPDYYQNE